LLRTVGQIVLNVIEKGGELGRDRESVWRKQRAFVNARWQNEASIVFASTIKTNTETRCQSN